MINLFLLSVGNTPISRQWMCLKPALLLTLGAVLLAPVAVLGPDTRGVVAMSVYRTLALRIVLAL